MCRMSSNRRCIRSSSLFLLAGQTCPGESFFLFSGGLIRTSLSATRKLQWVQKRISLKRACHLLVNSGRHGNLAGERGKHKIVHVHVLVLLLGCIGSLCKL
jgi:hypothetical protein